MTLITVEKYYLLFLIFSIVGWIYESILCSIEQKKWVNRGFLNGPYCPIYGWGALFDIIVLKNLSNPFALFFLGALLCCTLEYLTSYVMEKLFHMRWWDYTKRKFNINGRICLIGAIVFGAFSTVLILFIYPFTMKLINLIPLVWIHIICIVTLIGYIVDNVFSFIGVSTFQKKLKNFMESAKDKFEDIGVQIKNAKPLKKLKELYVSFAIILNAQQRRLLNAFPKLKSIKYDNIFEGVRNIFKRKKHKTYESPIIEVDDDTDLY